MTPPLLSLEKARSQHRRHIEPDVTSAFTSMALHPFAEVDANAQHFQLLERFAIVLYNKTSDLQRPQRRFFARRGRQWEDFLLPKMHYCSTQRELHIRLKYGAPVSRVKNRPDGWGWTSGEDSQSWVPVLNTVSVASKACSEIVKCSFKS